jgi:hypothetical protein
MINSWGRIKTPEDGKALQNFMICVEMMGAGISMFYAFPHKEYQIGGSAAGFRADAFTHAISIKDVVKDTIHVVSRGMEQKKYSSCAHFDCSTKEFGAFDSFFVS